MKRVFTISVMALLMMFVIVSQAFALERPHSYRDFNNDGDDHPWGGDNHIGDPTIITTDSYNRYEYTGLFAIDVTLQIIFSESFISYYNSYIEKQNRIIAEDNFEEPSFIRKHQSLSEGDM